MSVIARLGRHYRTFGLGGAAAFLTQGVSGWPRQIRAQAPGITHPAWLRLRTTDVSVYEDILLRREYDFELPYVPKTILDAGANIGMSAVFFANKFPDAKIAAVEAEAENFAMLEKNSLPYRSIKPVHAALWNYDGEIGVRKPDPSVSAGEWGFVVGAGAGTRAVTVQTLMNELGWDSIDLVKMDVEGAEKEIFEKPEWLKHVGCLMIEAHDWIKPGSSAAVGAALRDFRVEWHGSMAFYRR